MTIVRYKTTCKYIFSSFFGGCLASVDMALKTYTFVP